MGHPNMLIHILPNDIEKINFVQAPVKHLKFLHSVYWCQFSVSIFTTERQSQLVATCDQYEYWLECSTRWTVYV